MGFCEPNEYLLFMRQTPELERMLVCGIHLFKFWFSVSREEQLRRFISRRDDPLETLETVPCGYPVARPLGRLHRSQKRHVLPHPYRRLRLGYHPLRRQKRARLNCIRYFLHQLDYPGKDVKAIGKVDEKIVLVPDTRYKDKTVELGHD